MGLHGSKPCRHAPCDTTHSGHDPVHTTFDARHGLTASGRVAWSRCGASTLQLSLSALPSTPFIAHVAPRDNPPARPSLPMAPTVILAWVCGWCTACGVGTVTSDSRLASRSPRSMEASSFCFKCTFCMQTNNPTNQQTSKQNDRADPPLESRRPAGGGAGPPTPPVEAHANRLYIA